jgi:hypothetical protein
MADEFVNWFKEALRVAQRKYKDCGVPSGALEKFLYSVWDVSQTWLALPWEGGTSQEYGDKVTVLYLDMCHRVDEFSGVLVGTYRGQPETVDDQYDWRARFDGHLATMVR